MKITRFCLSSLFMGDNSIIKQGISILFACDTLSTQTNIIKMSERKQLSVEGFAFKIH